jgi:hypothetical protein
MSSKSDSLKAKQQRQTKLGWEIAWEKAKQIGNFIGWLGLANALGNRLAEEEPEPYNPHTSVPQVGPQGTVPASKTGKRSSPKEKPKPPTSFGTYPMPPIPPTPPFKTLNEMAALERTKRDPTLDLFDFEVADPVEEEEPEGFEALSTGVEVDPEEEYEGLEDILSNMGGSTELLGTAFSGEPAASPKSRGSRRNRTTETTTSPTTSSSERETEPDPEASTSTGPDNPHLQSPEQDLPKSPPPADPPPERTDRRGDDPNGVNERSANDRSMGDSPGAPTGTWHHGGLITDGDPATGGPMEVIVQEGECWVPPAAVEGMGLDLLRALNSLGRRDPRAAARANAGLVELLGNHGPLSDDQLTLLHQEDNCRTPDHPDRHQAFATRMREHRMVHGRGDGPFLERGGAIRGNDPRQNGEDVPKRLPEGGFVLRREAAGRFDHNVLARLTSAALVEDHWTVDAARRVVAGAMGIDLPPTDAEIDAMMAEPGYWRDRDPVMVQQVRDAIRRLCEGRERAREPFGTNRQHSQPKPRRT